MSKYVQEVKIYVNGNYNRNVHRSFCWCKYNVSVLLHQGLKKPTQIESAYIYYYDFL